MNAGFCCCRLGYVIGTLCTGHRPVVVTSVADLNSEYSTFINGRIKVARTDPKTAPNRKSTH